MRYQVSEHILRKILEKHGVNTISNKKNPAEPSILLDEIIRKFDTEDSVKYLQLSKEYCLAILTHLTGLNLRNNIFHGISAANICSKENAALILHILFILTALKQT